MKSKWMTNGLLKSIKMKDKLYKTLLQTTVNTYLFIALKTEFKFYQKSSQTQYQKSQVSILHKDV